jgi:hypothetical protein
MMFSPLENHFPRIDFKVYSMLKHRSTKEITEAITIQMMLEVDDFSELIANFSFMFDAHNISDFRDFEETSFENTSSLSNEKHIYDIFPVGIDQLPVVPIIHLRDHATNQLFLRKRDLTFDESLVAMNAFSHHFENPTQNFNRKLADKFSIIIRKRDFLCLQPETWLNDEIINFYMKLLGAKYQTEKPDKYYFFPTFFVDRLTHGGLYNYRNIYRWSKSIDVFTMEKVFFPLNIRQLHWALAVVFFKEKKIVYYDSMWSVETQQPVLPHPCVVVRELLHWLADEHMDKKGEQLGAISKWTLHYAGITCPQQRNSWDCGVFTLMCCDYLAGNLPLVYNQCDAERFRLRIGAAIIRGKLSYDDN